MWRGLVSVGVLTAVVLTAGEAAATVYTWTEDGIRHFTNSKAEIPEAHRDTVKTFPTSAAPGAPTPGDEQAEPDARRLAEETHEADVAHEAEGADDALGARLAAAEAYGRGVERGAQIALAQTRATGELARSLLETALHTRAPAPPAEAFEREPEGRQRARRRPELRVRIVPSRDRWPGAVFLGNAGPVAGCTGCCCGGIGYGFGAGRLVPHSHFYPSIALARRTPLFFPYGHQLDAGAFLVGRAFWVD